MREIARKYELPWIIRRNARSPSMTRHLHPRGLERVKKTHQITTTVRGDRDGAGLFLNIDPGYVIDDGPRNETPGDASCGGPLRHIDRAGRHVLVSQPRRVAPGGRSTDP